MGDVSELFRRALKNRQARNTGDRMEFHNNARKCKRETEAFFRRQIDENMSPIISPAVTPAADNIPNGHVKKYTKGETKNNPPHSKQEPKNKLLQDTKIESSNRFEMLQKWKKDKERRKAAEKANAKPIFKVSHVQHTLVPNLENINKTIKGKTFSSSSLPTKNTFKPPSNVKPLIFSLNPKVDVLSVLKSHKFDNTAKPSNPQPQISSRGLKKVVSSAPKAIASSAKLVKNGNDKTKQEKKQSKSVIAGTSRVTRSAAKSNATPISKKSPEKLIENLNNLKIISPEKNTAVSSNSKDEPMLVESSSSWDTGKSQDDTVGTTVTDQNAQALIKTPKKSGTQNLSHSGRKTPKKCVGFKDRRSNSAPEPVCTPHTPSFKLKFRKTPLKRNRDLDSEGCASSSSHGVFGSISPLGSESYRSASDDYPIEHSELENSMVSDVFVDTEEPPIYTSPFVTVSRGKQSARKEFVARRSMNKKVISPEKVEVDSNVSGAAYFNKKLNNVIERIEGMCNEWQGYLDGSEVPEEALDSINVTIGQSRLLIAKKFQQFRGLIEECRSRAYTEKPITCDDLHGFWDMIYMQVEDLDKRYSRLRTLRENGWKEVIPEKLEPVVKKSRGRPKKTQTNSKLKALIAAARQKKVTNEEKVFEGGYFEIRSPTTNVTPNIRKSATRLSVLTAEKSAKRCSSSPGLLMMKVSQSIKQGGGLTPGRSILKSVAAKSTGKKTVLFKEELVSNENCKAVLFSDSETGEERIKTKLRRGSDEKNISNCQEEIKTNSRKESDKENISSDNLMSFSPATPRRSARLSRNMK